MPTHRWHLHITPEAQSQFDKLPSSRVKMAVFSCLEDLLQAENPLTVQQVESIQSLPNVWKRRKGDWRIFFTFENKPLTYAGNTYKGTLFFIDVRRRNEKTVANLMQSVILRRCKL